MLPLINASLTSAPSVVAAPRSVLLQTSLVLAGSLLVALAAQVAIYLPGAPVPITLQALAVLLVGAALGARSGAASLLLYWTQGLVGLPVFAGALSGPVIAFGPTGGYLLGFVLAAFVMGKAIDTGFARTRARQAIAVCAAMAAIFLPGVVWLSVLLGPVHAVQAGLMPFLLGALVKALLVLALLPAVIRLRAR